MKDKNKMAKLKKIPNILTIPKRLQSIREFIHSWCLKNRRWSIKTCRLLNKGKFPCANCAGAGEVYNSYRGRFYLICPCCNGTGIGPEELWKDLFKEEKAEYLEKMKKANQVRAEIIIALERLTVREAEVLGWDRTFPKIDL